MSVAFSPIKIGSIEVNNRFVRSATYECMANETGEVTDELVSGLPLWKKPLARIILNKLVGK